MPPMPTPEAAMSPAESPTSRGRVLPPALRGPAEEILRWDGPARRGEDDAVHRLRVGARSLRAVLEASREALEPEAVAPAVVALRGIGRALGPARDAEVLRELCGRRLAEAEEELVPPAVAARLRRMVETDDRAAQGRARAFLESADHAAARELVASLVADPPIISPREDAVAVLGRGTDRQARRLRRRIARARDLEGTPEEAEALHRVRKAAKTLRYTVRILAGIPEAGLGRRRTAWEEHARAIQDVLGEHRDSRALAQRIRRAAERARAGGEDGFGYGVLVGIEAAHQRSALAEYHARAASFAGAPQDGDGR